MKIWIILVSIVLTMGSCASKDSFSVKGELAGLADGTILEWLPGGTHRDEKPEAEVNVKDGNFSFTGKVDSPRMFYIRVKGVPGVIPVLVENGVKASLRGKAVCHDSQGQKFMEFTEVEISGSPVHDEYLQKMSFKTKLDDLFQENQRKHADIRQQLTAARRNNDQALVDSLMLTEAYLELAEDEHAFFKTIGEETKKAVMEHKDVWWGPFLMLNSMQWFEEEQKEWFAAFAPQAKESYYGQIVAKELFPETLEGKTAPAFTVTDLQGKTVTLADLLKGKKYTLIDFWASWCGPCRKEIPNLKRIYDRFSSEGLEIISISRDKDKKAWQKALAEEQLVWPNFIDETGIAEAYGVKMIPAIFLLDANGTVLSIKLRGEALEKKMEELFQLPSSVLGNEGECGK